MSVLDDILELARSIPASQNERARTLQRASVSEIHEVLGALGYFVSEVELTRPTISEVDRDIQTNRAVGPRILRGGEIRARYYLIDSESVE